ncbi:hypothetical protein GN958_ATG01124 [Phytophthora infestans]|uniref:Uncharacterized protein n=1 Tax=Phytophthora infestans TaxID=4787 RepID=A0A8S9VGC4_PHYIN|nr:hypothetical protein GN958_ATG01124 [Phytophthora infestans]
MCYAPSSLLGRFSLRGGCSARRGDLRSGMTPTVAIFGAGRAVCWEAMGYGIRPSPSKYGFYPDLASSPVVEEKQKQLLLVEVSPEE